MSRGSFARARTLAAVLAAGLILPASAEAASRPDLRVNRPAAAPAVVQAGGTLTVKTRIRNAGRRAAGRSTAGIYLSADHLRGAGDRSLGRKGVKRLRRGKARRLSATVPVPGDATPGVYRVLVCADVRRRVRETNERNNCRASLGRVRVEAAAEPAGPQPGPEPPSPLTPEPEPDTPADDAPVPVTLTAPAEGASTADSTPQLAGEAAPGAFVTVTLSRAGAGDQTAQALPAADGSWTTDAPALADGSYTAVARQTDSLGRTQTSDSVGFTVDTLAPGVAISEPAAGAATGDTTPAVAGTAGNAPGDGAAITVRVWPGSSASGTPAREFTVQRSGGSWSGVVPGALTDGTYTVQASQTDAAGNTGTSAARTFSVDTTLPAVTLDEPLTGSATRDSTPTFSGGAGNEPGDDSTITVRVWSGTGTGGTLVQTRTTTRSGTSWSVSASPALADGTYTAQAEQKNATGEPATSAAHTFRVDTALPVVTVGSPAAGSSTSDATPAMSGAAGNATGDSPTVTVKVWAGSGTSGTLLHTLTVPRNGGTTWSTDAPALGDGTYTLRAEQADDAGNTGTSSTRTFTVDTAAPALTLTQPAANAATNDSTPQFSGAAGAANGDNPSITVTITQNGSPVQVRNATASAGAWSVSASPALADGTYAVVAEQHDAAGNSTVTTSRNFTVDTVAPAPTITQPTASQLTNDATPTFSGAAGDAAGDGTGLTVEIRAGATLVRTLSATRTGTTWTVTPGTDISDGTYTAIAKQSDSAGNNGQSGTVTFTIDTAGPAVSLTSPANGSATTDTTPALSGAAGSAAGDSATVTVKIYSGSSATGTPANSLPVTRSGGSWSTTSPALAEGTWTAQAEQSDSAGNLSKSGARTFHVDLTNPTVAVALSPSSPDGSNSFYRSVPDVQVTGNDANWGSLACTVDGSPVTVGQSPGTAHDVPVSGDGNHTVTCTATDAAGRTASDTKTFKVDSTAPAVAITTPAAGASTSLMRFAGTAGEASTVTVRIYRGTDTSGTLVATRTPSPSGGSWSFTLSPVLDDGAPYTVRAEQSDSAGNTGQATRTFTVPVTLLAAGDIAACDSSGDEATADILEERSGTIAANGDTVYADGVNPEASVANYNNCYGPSWGPFKSRTRPAIGNHEYNDDSTAQGYFDYFGSSAGTPGQGWYSYDKGSWHIIVLNTNQDCLVISCAATSAQLNWLRSDLASPANTSKQCTLAYFHHPRFSSRFGTLAFTAPIWDELYGAGADVVLGAHAHQYDRIKPKRPDGTVDTTFGIRSWVVGTGGAEFHSGSRNAAISDAFSDDTFGITEFTLNPTGYAYRFLPAAGGGGFTDSGTGTCHGAP